MNNKKRKDIPAVVHPPGNHYPTKEELEQGMTPNGGATEYKVTKDKSHEILMGRR
jgi:hypothetical protein